MLDRAFQGFVVLGGAVVAAVFLHWLTVEVIGFNYRDVFEGGLLSAGVIGVAYLADVLPR